jgi:hypothetical protein
VSAGGLSEPVLSEMVVDAVICGRDYIIELCEPACPNFSVASVFHLSSTTVRKIGECLSRVSSKPSFYAAN